MVQYLLYLGDSSWAVKSSVNQSLIIKIINNKSFKNVLQQTIDGQRNSLLFYIFIDLVQLIIDFVIISIQVCLIIVFQIQNQILQWRLMKPKKNQVASATAGKKLRMAPQPQAFATTEGRLDTEENRRRLEEKLQMESINKFRMKGARNRNNPYIEIKRASEIIIKKQANYAECMSGCLCVNENVYRIYAVDDYFNLKSRRHEEEAAELLGEDTDFDQMSPDRIKKTQKKINDIEMPGLETSQFPLNNTKLNLNEDVLQAPQDPFDQNQGIAIQNQQEDQKENKHDFEGGSRDNYATNNPDADFLSKKHNVVFLDYSTQPIQETTVQLPTETNVTGATRSEYMFQGGNVSEHPLKPNIDFHQIQEEDGGPDQLEKGADPSLMANLAAMKDELDGALNIGDDPSDVQNLLQEAIRKKMALKMQLMMASKLKVPKEFVSADKRILKIEQDSVVALRFFCPSSMRPFDAYAISSNGTFEFARFEKVYQCSPCGVNSEINVYKTQFKYQDINDHFNEVLIGKVVQNLTLLRRSIVVSEATGSDISEKYRLQGSIGGHLSECLFPKLPFGSCKATEYIIKDVEKRAAGDLEADQLQQYRQSKKLEAADQQQPDSKITSDPVIDLKEGKVTRQFTSCEQEYLSRGGRYHVKFPQGANVNQKTLIIAATMMLDMNFYDRNCFIC